MDTKIAETRKDAADKYILLRDEISQMRNTLISRQEHDQDIEKVQQGILVTKEELRGDIRILHSMVTDRFDTIMKLMLEIKSQK